MFCPIQNWNLLGINSQLELIFFPPFHASLKTMASTRLVLAILSISLLVCTVNAFSMSAKGPQIEVVSQPSKDFLEKKGVFSWGTWGCEASKFPWTYDSTESCYILKGKVTVTPSDGRDAVTIGEGDFATFPAGMSCTWDVTEAIHKHFCFF